MPEVILKYGDREKEGSQVRLVWLGDSDTRGQSEEGKEYLRDCGGEEMPQVQQDDRDHPQETKKAGTEPAFTGKYHDWHEEGLYRCACCGTDLFLSDTKYESGTGWPSFWEPVSEKNVELKRDLTYGMERTEALCARCGAHLGHVFDDGPPPTAVEDAYVQTLRDVSWPNPIVNSAAAAKSKITGPSGMKMTGPYDYEPPCYWLVY
jgi:methionine-R-sulfoxide reductase